MVNIAVATDHRPWDVVAEAVVAFVGASAVEVGEAAVEHSHPGHQLVASTDNSSDAPCSSPEVGLFLLVLLEDQLCPEKIQT